ncbi:MAG: hypothetical protein JWM46_767 [Candidatus Kaiserbacteria bacterium]|nr:hypothetical protein [Candidatus Kaiserbacteria bacterium]
MLKQPRTFTDAHDPMLLGLMLEDRKRLLMKWSVGLLLAAVIMTLLGAWQAAIVVFLLVTLVWSKHRQLCERVKTSRFGEGDKDLEYLDQYFNSHGIRAENMHFS